MPTFRITVRRQTVYRTLTTEEARILISADDEAQARKAIEEAMEDDPDYYGEFKAIDEEIVGSDTTDYESISKVHDIGDAGYDHLASDILGG